MILHSHSFVLPKISVDVIMIVKPFFQLLGYATAIGVAAIRICRGGLRTGSHFSISNERGGMSYRVGISILASRLKKAILLSLIASGLLLIGCGGGGSGGSGGGDSHSGMNNMSVDGGGGGPPLLDEVELSISPFNEGLHIQWHNLPAIERAGGIYIHLNLTNNDSPPELLRERITIEDLTDNDNRYELDGLSNGTAYRLVGVAIELAGNISRVIDIVWSEPWQTKTNALDQEGNGIVVGVNYDGDGRADGLDGDIDDDGVNNTRADGTVWDLCRRGELDWLSNSISDYDNDGCRDDGTKNDGYGEDTDDDNDGLMDRDEPSRCSLNSDCDNDTVLDGDEAAVRCVLITDCDNDTVLDGDEAAVRCVLITDCDNDTVLDGDEAAVRCVLITDCDNDTVLDGDEAAVRCVLITDCDSDTVLDGDEVMGCVLKQDCDEDDLVDSEDSCPAGLGGWNNDGTNDMDGDGCRNDEDIDDDGDGLIEIETAEELNAVRWVLDGTGYKVNEGAELDQTGCGGGNTMTVCNGYELIRNISLADYIADNYPTVGWEPIASDGDTSNTECDGDKFTAIFDGNGFEVSGLFINRSTEDCIGLFGHATGTIRHLGVIADRVIGRNDMGSLIGKAVHTSILQSYVVSSEVRGNRRMGGLIGSGHHTRIVQSYLIIDTVHGESFFVGGLIGDATNAKIIQSYIVANSVSGDDAVGSLLGSGPQVEIVQSYVINDSLQGRGVSILVGLAANNKIKYAYWDNQTNDRTNNGELGTGQTTSALRSPTDYTDIYANWSDGAISEGTTIAGVDHNGTIWCDEDQSGMIEDDEKRDNSHPNGDNRVWDFGTDTDYPALRCTGDSLADQRAWWHLNATHKPQLNQDRLNAYLDGTLP